MPPATPAITIVSGLPRSGTSLMMQMLIAGGLPALSDGRRAADADNPRGYYELEAVKRTRSDPSWLGDAPGKAVKVVHLLVRDLPPGFGYRLILMRRAIEEVLASQRLMLQRQGKPTGSPEDDRRLARVFETQLAEMKSWVGRQPHFRMLEVWYGQLLDDAAGQARLVSEFCGGLDAAAMAAVVDRTLRHHRA